MITLFTIHVTTNGMITILGVALCLCFIAWTGRKSAHDRGENVNNPVRK